MYVVRRVARWGLGLFVLTMAGMLAAGCGGDSGGGPEPTPDCAISGVNTSQENSWLTGADVDIRWSTNRVPGTVLIELLKGGTVVSVIAAGASNTGFYPWVAATGGMGSGSDFGIRVTGTGEPACSAEINDLTILDVADCGLTVAAVADSMAAGNDYEITWTGVHTSGQVDIELWTTGISRGLIGTIATGTPDDGSYVWLVDSFNNGTSSVYALVVRDALVTGCEGESAPFKMVDNVVCSTTITGPSSIPVSVGSQMEIFLSQENGSGVVDLRLYAGNLFVPGGIIADNVQVLDGFTWTVSDYGFTQSHSAFNIRAIDVADPYCVDKSDRFTITP